MGDSQKKTNHDAATNLAYLDDKRIVVDLFREHKP